MLGPSSLGLICLLLLGGEFFPSSEGSFQGLFIQGVIGLLLPSTSNDDSTSNNDSTSNSHRVVPSLLMQSGGMDMSMMSSSVSEHAISLMKSSDDVVNSVLKGLKEANVKSFLFHLQLEKLHQKQKESCATKLPILAKDLQLLRTHIAGIEKEILNTKKSNKDLETKLTLQNDKISRTERTNANTLREIDTKIRNQSNAEISTKKALEDLMRSEELLASKTPTAVEDVLKIIESLKLKLPDHSTKTTIDASQLSGVVEGHLKTTEEILGKLRNGKSKLQKNKEYQIQKAEEEMGNLQEEKDSIKISISKKLEKLSAAQDDLRLGQEMLKSDEKNREQAETICTIKAFEWKRTLEQFQEENANIKAAQELLINQVQAAEQSLVQKLNLDKQLRGEVIKGEVLTSTSSARSTENGVVSSPSSARNTEMKKAADYWSENTVFNNTVLPLLNATQPATSGTSMPMATSMPTFSVQSDPLPGALVDKAVDILNGVIGVNSSPRQDGMINSSSPQEGVITEFLQVSSSDGSEDDEVFLNQLQMLQLTVNKKAKTESLTLSRISPGLEKVRTMIEKMISKIMSEIAKESGKQEMCKKEGKKADIRYKNLKKNLDSLTESLIIVEKQLPEYDRRMNANIGKIREVDAFIAEETQNRAIEKNVFSEIITIGETSKSSIEKVVARLRTVYENLLSKLDQEAQDRYMKADDILAAQKTGAVERTLEAPALKEPVAPDDATPSATPTKEVAEPAVVAPTPTQQAPSKLKASTSNQTVKDKKEIVVKPVKPDQIQPPQLEEPPAVMLPVSEIAPKSEMMAPDTNDDLLDVQSLLDSSKLLLTQRMETPQQALPAASFLQVPISLLKESDIESLREMTTTDLSERIDKTLEQETRNLQEESARSLQEESEKGMSEQMIWKKDNGRNSQRVLVFPREFSIFLDATRKALEMLDRVLEGMIMKVFTVKGDEIENSNNFNSFLAINKLLKETKKNENLLLNRKKEKLLVVYNNLKTDFEEKSKEMQTHNSFVVELKKTCSGGGPEITQKEKHAKREKEIEGLKQAIKILVGQ